MTGNEVLALIAEVLMFFGFGILLPALVITGIRWFFCKEGANYGSVISRMAHVLLAYMMALVAVMIFSVIYAWDGNERLIRIVMDAAIQGLALFAYGVIVSAFVAIFSIKLSSPRKHPWHHFNIVVGCALLGSFILLIAEGEQKKFVAQQQNVAQPSTSVSRPSRLPDNPVSQDPSLQSQQLDRMLDVLEATEPRVNPSDDRYQQVLVDQIEGRVVALERSGIPVAKALQIAAFEVVGRDLQIPPAPSGSANRIEQENSAREKALTEGDLKALHAIPEVAR